MTQFYEPVVIFTDEIGYKCSDTEYNGYCQIKTEFLIKLVTSVCSIRVVHKYYRMVLLLPIKREFF